MRVRPLLLVTTFAFTASAQTRTEHRPAPADSAAIHNVFWQPNELHQGSPIFLTVELERPATRVTGSLIDKTITFFRDPKDAKTWHALAGVDLFAEPGQYRLDVTATLAGGRIARHTDQVNVVAGDFKTGDITVPQNYVTPTDTEQKQIAQDEVLKKRAYAHTASHPLWSGDFIKPVDAPSTPTFGESRILNEEKTSLHTGTDFPCPEGTTVRVANSGTVVLVRDLFYEGNTVIVDHGLGLFTVYLHMSRIDVHQGDKLDKGAKLGLSGASGRVTGPHLHFGVRWNGVWIDPVQVLALTLPRTTAQPTAKSHEVRRPVAHTR
ncbi:MAG TPA: M23 family metallopeptidase [Candidatus Aquilonibacter sp.]|nr:M23 family metallopeptidase [Candidatus Aquilonibacter sp.]